VEPLLDRPSTIKPQRAPKEPEGLIRFRTAFVAVMAAGASVTLSVRDGMTVRAVPVTAVRAEFDKRYSTGESDDPKKRAEALRKAFRRALKASMEQFGAETQDDVEYVWALKGTGL
jgi:hypothetical protein